MRRFLIPGLLLLATAMPAVAQEAGGLSLSPEALSIGGPRGLARPLPFAFPSFTASDVQAMPTPADRRQRNRDMIARLRGDGGFIDGFAFGQPLAASRQPPPPPPEPLVPIIIDQRTRIVNKTFEGPVAITVGENNVVQQQGGSNNGPTAQQQVVNVGERAARRGGGAVNTVTPQGNIVQTAPVSEDRAARR
jgi:hypothetical protein